VEQATDNSGRARRPRASQTIWLHAGESRTLSFSLPSRARYSLSVRYSNDNPTGPLETVTAWDDGVEVGHFTAQNTRPPGGVPGSGWNVFLSSGPIGAVDLEAGIRRITVSVAGGDGYGVEIDVVILDRVG